MNDYLMHYGVIGMKWGVRRYQNPDGTRTEAGKKKERKEYRITQKKEGYNISPRRVKKNMNNMTDKELRTALNRINMQREVKQANPSAIKRGEDSLKRLIAIGGTLAGIVAAANKFPGTISTGKDIANNILGSNVRWFIQGVGEKVWDKL